jgi:hypothetical protein
MSSLVQYVPPDQISQGHCYQLRADNGVRIVAKVHEITDDGIKIREYPSDAPVATIATRWVRFYWRKP